MNCCDYECRQGRDCPARKTTTCPHCYGIGYDASGHACTCTYLKPAAVARVGRKHHDRDALRGSPWRLYLKDLARSLLLVLAVMMISALVVAIMTRT